MAISGLFPFLFACIHAHACARGSFGLNVLRSIGVSGSYEA